MMTNGADVLTITGESEVGWQTADGLELKGRLLHFSSHSVTFALHHPGVPLRVSEVLAPFQVLPEGVLSYTGRAVLRELVNTGSGLVCHATLEGGLDSGVFEAVADPTQLSARFRAFMKRWQTTCKILTPYKIAIADLQSFLTQLRLWLEQVELGIRAAPSGDRLELEQNALEKLGKEIVPIIDHFFQQFERLTPQITPEMLPAHRAYLQLQLHPLVLCSPFAYRTYAKPLGFAGDYEMVNMMTRNPFEGGTVFAKLVNLWFLEQAPAQAHRNRVAQLERVLAEEVGRCAAEGRLARVLNLGCGPAVEIQRFLAGFEWSSRARCELLDFDDETLTYARKVLEAAKATHGRSTELIFSKVPVTQLLKQAARTVERPREQQYDFIYCAGLFDYLGDCVCQKLMTILYSWLAPGGLLLVTNVDPSNPLRHGMEQLLEWHLVYRDPAALRAIRPLQVKEDDAQIRAEMTGVNVFLEIRKGRHA